MNRLVLAALAPLYFGGALAAPEGLLGYYRQPALHGDTLVFHAEGDLWKVPVQGGTAQRLTTHAARERFPVISPDGKEVAFIASYEGPTEIYTMPLSGGRPVRQTYEGVSGTREPMTVAWNVQNEILYRTWFFATRDTSQLAVLDLESGHRTVVPLEQASDGTYGEKGNLYFTRLPRQRSFAKRYRGGLIENLWRWRNGEKEAVALTADFDGTSRAPMWWDGRLYFVSDRDGTMNLWSMNAEGKDLKQHTDFVGWDVLGPALNSGRIVFQNRADIWIHDIKSGLTKPITIRLASDFDQQRERWVNGLGNFLNSYYISHDGKHLGLTVRGRGFVVPSRGGRVVSLPHPSGTRIHDLKFLPGTTDVLYLSDQTGELEFWKHAANGFGDSTQLSRRGTTYRHDGIPSPDGKLMAHTDRDQVLWLMDLATGKSVKVAESQGGNDWDYIDLAWSPDGRWLAFVEAGPNEIKRIYLYDTKQRGKPVPVTTDRLDSFSPAFGAGGKWLYFLSDRTFRSVQSSPWGARQPEALLDRSTSIFALDLVGGQRSPFAAAPVVPGGFKAPKAGTAVTLNGIQERLHPVPLMAGNYRYLTANRGFLYFISTNLGSSSKHLTAFPISSDRGRHRVTNVSASIQGYEMSGNGATIVTYRSNNLYVFSASGSPASTRPISLSGLTYTIKPADEWRQMFVDAWRLHRDYFYDPKMHNVDWEEIRHRHEALLPRITTRWELDDLIGQMVGELSAMHTDIQAGDIPRASGGASIGYLGGHVAKAEEGFRIEFLYQTDPDYPQEAGPLRKPDVDLRVGDVILSVDGVDARSVPDIGMLLQNKAGREVLIESRRIGVGGTKMSLVRPLTLTGLRNLKTTHWEHTRRLEAEKRSEGEIGYFHMRAMTSSNYSEFVKGFYPVFNRKGLIIDMRQNYGGNIDAWILSRLSRKPWMYWQKRNGRPFANMHYSFNGHMVVLVDAYTISDGEAFSEGFRRLGLGPLIGTRTWGGGIWLRSVTRLVDGGMARSPETGVYSPERTWLIEGRGLEPDIVVDNLPHETFNGRDAQLEAAVAYLKKKIAEEPPKIPQAPDRPDKSFEYPEPVPVPE